MRAATCALESVWNGSDGSSCANACYARTCLDRSESGGRAGARGRRSGAAVRCRAAMSGDDEGVMPVRLRKPHTSVCYVSALWQRGSYANTASTHPGPTTASSDAASSGHAVWQAEQCAGAADGEILIDGRARPPSCLVISAYVANAATERAACDCECALT